MSDSTPTDGTPIVPFGKYKGQYVTEMKKDRSYVDWFLLQADLVSRYPVIYNIIVGGSKAKPKRKKQDTPQHNAMQAQYLGEVLRTRVGAALTPSRERFAFLGYDRPDGRVHVSVGQPEFEGHGWDVEWDTYFDVVVPGEHPPGVLERRHMHHHWIRVHLELKPAISDDYPVVLRQVMDRRARQFPNGVGSGCNPGGEVVGVPLPDWDISPAYTYRLCRDAELDELQAEVSAARARTEAGQRVHS